MRRFAIGVGMLLLSSLALAQTSSNFTLEEHTFNSGGTPSQGLELISPSFSITLASIGDGVVASGLGSSSFQVDAGFDAAYPPPGEVAAMCGPGEPCLVFTDEQTLTWPAERSAGVYNLYRDDTDDGYGSCEQQDLAAPTATDLATPLTGNASFYLVTVENRLAEAGTKGFRSNAVERQGAVDLPVCP